MACLSCRSENVRAFTTQINIDPPAKASPTSRVLAYPKLLVCLDCGLADVLLSEEELRSLRKIYSSAKPEIPADPNVSLPPKDCSEVNE